MLYPYRKVDRGAMTPFSCKLKYLRESRGVRQRSLALVIGVSPTYLSALEQGRKCPPQNLDFFTKLQVSLQLADEEMHELHRLASATETLGPLARGTSPMQLEIAADFAAKLKSLQPLHIRAIKAILDMAKPPLETTTS